MNRYIKPICAILIITLFAPLLSGCFALSFFNRSNEVQHIGMEKIMTTTQMNKNIIPAEYLTKLSANDMIAYAAYKNVKDNSEENPYTDTIFDSALENILISESEETKEGTYGKANYPFVSIEIYNTVRFIILARDDSVSFLESVCGKGDIIVIIAEFMPYYLTDEKVLMPLLWENETAIIFIGVSGIYSCLTNGTWSAIDPNLAGESDSYTDFSSYKTITDDTIQKDESGNIVTFTAYRKDNTYTIKYCFVKGEDFEFPEPKIYDMLDDSLTEISVETTYEVLTLHSIISDEIILKKHDEEEITE